MESLAAFIEVVGETAEAVLADCGTDRSELVAAGLCLPARFNGTRDTVLFCPNIPTLNGVPLASLLGSRLKLPVVLEYDGYAIAIGENWKGASAGFQNVAHIAIGTGIGGALLINGKIHRGASGLAGSFGWFVVERDWWLCPSRERGNLESRIAGPPLAEATGFLLDGDGPRNFTALLGGPTESILAVSPVLGRLIEYLAMVVTNLVTAVSPEAIVLGGGVGSRLEPVLPLINRLVEASVAPYAVGTYRLLPSTLGDDAGVLGAGRVAFQALPDFQGGDS